MQFYLVVYTVFHKSDDTEIIFRKYAHFSVIRTNKIELTNQNYLVTVFAILYKKNSVIISF